MKKLLFITFSLLSVCACGGSTRQNEKEEEKPLEYCNPVFEPILADPSIVIGHGGVFYAYGTEDSWGNSYHRVAVLSSTDMVNWRFVADAFDETSRPSWKPDGGLWAPDVVLSGDDFRMYYSISLWGDSDPAIGVALSNTRSHPTFTDHGPLFSSGSIGVPNSIDPFYFEEDGRKYLFWGSYSTAATQGTYGARLSDDGLSVPDPDAKFKIAAGDFEAVMIHKRNGYYYFFGSKGGCCTGAQSTYQLRVARSESITGPYLDRDGKDVAERGYGTLILSGNATYAGPGHCSRIITDDDGDDWLFYHAILKEDPYIGLTSRRCLMLDRVHWDDDQWPLVHDGTPSTTTQPGPVWKKR